jgi:hypothetical protein
MAIKKTRQALISAKAASSADTRVVAMARKPAPIRGFLAPPPGHHWPRAWPGQPGAILAQPEPSWGPSGGGELPVKLASGVPPGLSLGVPMDIRTAAWFIGCSPWTVRQTLLPRGLPHFRSGASGRLIFYRDQVIRWIYEQQSKGGKQIR